jgi:nucleoside-diphosphate-sugar epimerase
VERALHVVVGGAGGTGRALLDELLRRGDQVRAIGRHRPADLPREVEWVTADVRERAHARSALAGAAVVYHAAQPPYTRWPAEFPALTASIADAAESEGAKLVLADNLYAYGPGASPLSERTPERATDRKGVVRRQMVEDLLARHASGRLEVAIGRSPSYFGPRGTGTALGERVFGAAVAGKPVRWIGRLDMPHSTIFLPDLAAGLATLGARSDASGKVWHLPSQPPLTGRQFCEAVVAAADSRSTIAADRIGVLRLVGLVVPFVREVAAVGYQHSEPFVTDSSAFQTAFGDVRVTPLEQAIAASVDWWRAHLDRSAT